MREEAKAYKKAYMLTKEIDAETFAQFKREAAEMGTEDTADFISYGIVESGRIESINQLWYALSDYRSEICEGIYFAVIHRLDKGE